jgi:hypothetical protein
MIWLILLIIVVLSPALFLTIFHPKDKDER